MELPVGMILIVHLRVDYDMILGCQRLRDILARVALASTLDCTILP